MANQDGRSRLKNLDARLKAARARRGGGSADGDKKLPGGGVGVAMRIAVDLVAGIIVGVLIGWLLDNWLGTGPWLMLLFFVLGAAAGITNVMRTARRIEADVAARRKEQASQASRDDRTTGA